MNGEEVRRLSKVVFLGTGTSQGVPIVGCLCQVCTSKDWKDIRLRSSVALEGFGTRVVVDTGPDFRAQMLRERIDALDAVVYTHEHKDHLAGMDDIRPFNYLQKKEMVLHASERVEVALRRDFHYAFDENKHGGVPDVRIERVENDRSFDAGGMTWMPLPVLHGELPIHGYRVDDVAYITDANGIPQITRDRLKNLEVLILNALRIKPHYSHYALSEALEVANQIGAKKTYLTHISHLMGNHADVSQELPKGVSLAYDGLVLKRLPEGWHEESSPWTSISMKP